MKVPEPRAIPVHLNHWSNKYADPGLKYMSRPPVIQKKTPPGCLMLQSYTTCFDKMQQGRIWKHWMRYYWLELRGLGWPRWLERRHETSFKGRGVTAKNVNLPCTQCSGLPTNPHPITRYLFNSKISMVCLRKACFPKPKVQPRAFNPAQRRDLRLLFRSDSCWLGW